MTRLHELLQALHIACTDTRSILGISDDSRIVQKDWLFVSHRDTYMHQLLHIKEALQKGAVVLCEYHLQHADVYWCAGIERIQQALLQLYYGDLCAEAHVCGITGTNGKTSTAGILTQLLRQEGLAVLRIGTHEIDMQGEKRAMRNTTPDAFLLASLLQEAKTRGIRYIVMEVSSHAVDQNRICMMAFDTLIYTNMTEDHLDYHQTSVHYHCTKCKLQRYLKPGGHILVNIDAPGNELLIRLRQKRLLTIGRSGAHMLLREEKRSRQGVWFYLNEQLYQVSLAGKWCCDNAAAAVMTATLWGLSPAKLQQHLAKVRSELGRMQLLQEAGITVLIDYAHTESALIDVLQYARTICEGKLYCIIGCGGNRDREKRPQMARAAQKYADHAVFTADNPRDEMVWDILWDMLRGIKGAYAVFENRRYAIKHCVNNAQKDDIIVIAGKGDEQSQEIEGNFYAFHDVTCVRELLRGKEESKWK